MTVSVTPTVAPTGSEAPSGAPVPNSNSSVAAGLAAPMTPSAAPAASTSPTGDPAPAQPAGERPAGLPQEFSSFEELAAAYEALKAGAAQPAPQAADPVKIITDATQAAGLNFDKFYGEFAEKGALSEASYAELAKAGVSRQFMDAAIAGQQAAIQAELTDIYSVVGGQEGFKQVQAWAAVNLSPAEKADLNSIIDTAPANVVKMALQGLQARYEAKMGSEPSLVGGGPAQGVSAFQSIHQVTQAMSDPRYAADPAYRDEVTRRLAVSNVFG